MSIKTIFRMEENNIIMVKGDTLAFAVEFDGLDQDLDSAYFSCKSKRTDANYVFQKSLGDGIEQIDADHYSVRVAPEDTADLEAGQYYYDCQISANGDVATILSGVLTLKQDVTEEV